MTVITTPIEFLAMSWDPIFTKGPSIYYVIQIWGPERPPPSPL